MDKLKKVFSPGNKGDDEVLYGSSGPEVPQAKDSGSGPYNTGVPQGDAAPTLYTDPKAEKKDHGVLRQILNPGGNKHDEQKYGETASTQPPLGATTAGGATALHSKPEAEKDGGITRQILNPSGDKYDDTRHGTTATAQRDLLDRSTGNVVPGMAASPSHAEADNASTLSIKSGVSGPYASHTDDHRAAGSTDDSHLGRDAGIAGAGVGAGAYGADRSMANTGKENLQQPSSTERSFPLGGGTGTSTVGDSNRPTSSVYSADTTTNPSTTSAGASKNYGGLGTAAGSAIGAEHNRTASGNQNPVVPGWEEHGADGHVHSFKGVPTDSTPATGYVHQTKGPHSTDIANLLDPHVPGEFPSEDGTDRHHQGALGGFGVASTASTAAPTTSSTQEQSPLGGFGGANTASTSGPGTTTSDDHHYGRDAALAGGAGAAGLGAYEATKDRSAPISSQLPSSTSETVPVTQRQHIGTDGSIGSSTLPTSSSQPKEHHYGRDTALAGGAGAAALGTYEATKDRHDPSSLQTSTLPDRSLPATQRQHIGTDGPIGSSTLPDRSLPATQREHISTDRPVGSFTPPSSTAEPTQHHLGHDAAAAGGVGAAGVGAYELGKDRSAPSSQTASGSHPESIGYPSVQDSQQRADDLMGAPLDTSTQAYPSTIPASSSQATTQDHHYGRDAAVTGGAGATGLGAYEATRGRDDTGPASKTVGPHSSDAANIVDPRVQPSQTAQPSGPLNMADPRAEHNLPKQQEKDHHYGRDAAVAGGVGAAGYGAYEATKDRGDTGPASKTIGPHSSNVANVVDPRVQPQPEKMKDHTTTGPYQSDTLNKADPRVTSDPAQAQQKEHHYGRDAAVAGGAGAAGYGAYEAIDKHEQEKQAKEAAKEQAKAEKAHEKEEAKLEKQHSKEQEKAEKQHQKDIEHEEKERRKAAEKAEKHNQKEQAKEAEKAEKQHQKELEKAEKAEHKQDEKLAAAQAKEQEKLEKAHEKELHKGQHNKLHKDPPEEKEKKPSLIHRIFHPHEKESDIPEQNVQSGSRAQGLETDEARLVQEQRELASGAPGERGYDPSTSTGTAGAAGAAHGGVGSDGIVTEPHTGLPMNVGKYGSGAGGTDGAPQIPGYHETTGSSSLGQGTTGASEGADWEGIKKANTPY